MYKYELLHSSARFVDVKIYKDIGFDVKITAAEDYDFQNKLNRAGIKTGFVDAEALHLGEPTHLWPHLKKYYAYGKDMINYHAENKEEAGGQVFNIFRNTYIKNWRRFLKQPFMGLSFLCYHTLKYAAGGLGFATAKLQSMRGSNG